MDPQTQELLDEGIASLRAGRKEEARQKLMQVINADERNEFAWLYLSEAVEEDENRQICLENVLAINPANERAETELRTLQEKIAREKEKADNLRLICPACGTANPLDRQYCVNCFASLEQAARGPAPASSPPAEDVFEERPRRATQHKSFLEMLDTWAEMFALPGQARLAEEHTYARWGLIVPGIMVASGIAYFFVSLTNVGTTLLLPSGSLDLSRLLPIACGGAVAGAVIGLISFLFNSGVFYLVARLFQGKGEFVVQSYLLSLVYGPFSLIACIVSPLALLGLIDPRLNFIPVLISIPVGILMLIMLVRVLKSAHGYSTGAALGTIFLPGLFFGCVGGVLGVVVAGSLLANLPLNLP
jgi:hypothetical protein